MLVLCLGGFVVWILQSQTPRVTQKISSSTDQPRVVASFYPLAEFAQAVGGQFVDVTTITPNGTEPHEYEPTPEQMATLFEADLFLYNGQGVDAWADRVIKDLEQNGVRVLQLSTIEPSIINNPHVWLNPLMVQTYVQTISDTLKKIDPKNTEIFEQNANAFQQELGSLHESYQFELKNCSKRFIVTSHNAFVHLSMLYHFNILPIAGLSPEEEPSAGRLAEISTLAKEQKVKHIFFESLVSPKLSETIAREIGAKTLVLNPLEGLTAEEQIAGKNYLSVMRENLVNLKIGMVCQ